MDILASSVLSTQELDFYSQSCNINHGIVGGEIIQDIALREVAEAQITGQCHCHAREHADTSREMRDFGETVHSWCLQRAIDEERVMMTDKGEGYDANRLEDTGVDQKVASKRAADVGWLNRTLRDDCDDYDGHGD